MNNFLSDFIASMKNKKGNTGEKHTEAEPDSFALAGNPGRTGDDRGNISFGIFTSMFEDAVKKYEVEKNRDQTAAIDPDIEEIWRKMPVNTRYSFFHGDIRQAQNVLKNLAGVICPDDDDFIDKSLQLDRAWELFVSVWSRSLIMRPEELIDSITLNSRNDDIPRKALLAGIAESLGFICAGDESKKEGILASLMLKQMTDDLAGQNTEIEDRFLDDPEYGLIPSKPVFVNGFGPHRMYLDSLCTSDGKDLSYDRRGSMEVDGIDGPVDIYDLFLPNGKRYMTIYQCVYGEKNSRTAPRGLRFKHV